MRSRSQGLLFGLLAACFAGLVHAGPIVIDQPLTNTAIQINAFSQVGQSFTAGATSIESIELALRNFNRTGYETDHDVTVTLFSGEGFLGPQLAHATVDVDAILGDQPTSFVQWIAFGMQNTLLTVGNVYTCLVFDAAPRYGLDYHLGDVYAGGHAYNADLGFGSFGDILNNDLTFRITSAVPEPSALAMLVLGLLLIPAVQKRFAQRRHS